MTMQLTADMATVYDALDRLPDDRQEEICEALRIQAVDEGCRWSAVAGKPLVFVMAIAGWDDDDLAEVLGEVAPNLFAEAGFRAEG